MKKTFLAAAALALLVSAPACADTWKVDKEHSSVSFKVKHLLSWTQGNFRDFEGSVDFDPANWEAASASGTIQAASIDTNNAKRDEHLKSADFFDTAKYPALTFKTTKVEKTGEKTGKVHGLLAIHGVEKPVVLDVEFLGVEKDPWGNVAAGFTATTSINRKDFGITWNQALDTGGLLVGEEVRITLDIAAVKK